MMTRWVGQHANNSSCVLECYLWAENNHECDAHASFTCWRRPCSGQTASLVMIDESMMNLCDAMLCSGKYITEHLHYVVSPTQAATLLSSTNWLLWRPRTIAKLCAGVNTICLSKWLHVPWDQCTFRNKQQQQQQKIHTDLEPKYAHILRPSHHSRRSIFHTSFRLKVQNIECVCLCIHTRQLGASLTRSFGHIELYKHTINVLIVYYMYCFRHSCTTHKITE